MGRWFHNAGLVLGVGLAALAAPGCAAGRTAPTPQPGPDVLDSPWYVDRMVALTREKNELIEDNLPDCPRTYQALVTYLEENLDDLRRITAWFHKLEAGATDRDRWRAAHRILDGMGAIFEESMAARQAFSRTCPEEFLLVRQATDRIQRGG